MIPSKEAKGHLKRASTSHKRECGKRYGSRDLRVRSPRSTLGVGKPRTWGRGKPPKSGQRIPADKGIQGRCHRVERRKGRVMRQTQTILQLLRERGKKR